MNTGIKEYDKLFYPFTKTLVNKFDELNREKLKLKEEAYSKNKMEELDLKPSSYNKVFKDGFSINSLKALHKFILGGVYSWAGTFKQVSLFKNQDILGGASVQYCPPEYLEDNINDVLWKMNNTKWDSLSNDDKILKFADQFQYLWQCHPFNEGNTRTTSKFMEAFAKEKNIPVDFNKLFHNPTDLRNGFVLYSTGEPDCKKAVFKYFRDSATYSDIESPSLDVPDRYYEKMIGSMFDKQKEERVIKINNSNNEEMEMD
ncbi:MAG: Fic family protein [Acholeplasmatales bacterium]|nr:Fic family protein [Acholeplasmatales bacterium]